MLEVPGAAVQLSLAVGLPSATPVAVQEPALVEVLMLAGQVMLGRVVSLMVTTPMQVAVLPWPSLTVRVTLLVPMLAQVRLDGLAETRLTVPQLSVEPLLMSVGVMEVVVPERGRLMLRQIALGGVISAMVTVPVQVVVLPLPSLMVRVTVLEPMLAQVKADGLTEARLTVPQLSVEPLLMSVGVMLAVVLERLRVMLRQIAVGGVASVEVRMAALEFADWTGPVHLKALSRYRVPEMPALAGLTVNVPVVAPL